MVLGQSNEEIKKIKLSDVKKLEQVEKELSSLIATFNEYISDSSQIQSEINNLKSINLKLWDIEDGKRSAEKNKDFGENFIELARNVYKFNDERAKIKLAIKDKIENTKK